MNRNKLLVASILVFTLLLSSLSFVTAQSETLVIWADETRAPLLIDLGEQFEDDYGIAVDVQQMGLGDARDQLLVAGPAGEGPDILVTAHDSIGQFVANGAIVPLDLAGLEDEFFPSALDLFTYSGQLWGVPYAIENVALIRNVDLVPEAPQTWQEVREIAEQLQESGDAQYGFLVQTGNTYHNFPITSAFGGYIFGVNDDGTFDVSDVGLNSEGGLAAAEWLSGMYQDGLMVPDVNDDVVFALFEEGQLGMLITGPWWSQRIIDAAEAGGFEYSIDVLPGAEGGLEQSRPFSGGQGLVISAFSENQLLAEQFLLDFVATQEFMQAIFDDNSRPPAFQDVDTSDEPNIEGFIAAGAEAIPMPAIPEMGAVWASSDAALTLISQGGDPVQAMNTAVSQIADAIQLVQSEDRIVVVAGNLQSEAGCENDWDPACLVTQLTDEDGDGVYTGTFSLPAGEYEWKIALNGGWDENYGVDGEPGGANVPLSLTEDADVTFEFDDNTKALTATVGS
jgi:arabinogalactan oligomer / maltooligosaccharide transport system substrate-binding protein